MCENGHYKFKTKKVQGSGSNDVDECAAFATRRTSCMRVYIHATTQVREELGRFE